MDPERWLRLSPLLDSLFELPPEARAERLREMREEDPELTWSGRHAAAACDAMFNRGCMCGLEDIWSSAEACEFEQHMFVRQASSTRSRQSSYSTLRAPRLTSTRWSRSAASRSPRPTRQAR